MQSLFSRLKRKYPMCNWPMQAGSEHKSHYCNNFIINTSFIYERHKKIFKLWSKFI